MSDRRANKSEAVRSGAGDLENEVARLARSVAEIEVTLRNVEAEIEADACERIRTLRSEAMQQLAVLRSRHQGASRLVSQLVTAPEGSWSELQREAQRALTEARTVADAIIARLRRAVPD
jgi:hypothetical protein